MSWVVQGGECRKVAWALSFLLAVSLALAGVSAQAETADSDSSQRSTSLINLWLNEAPMPLLIEHLAQLSGREADIGKGLDVTVSGRFDGSLVQTLAKLAAEYPVLFDLDDERLYAVGSDDGSSKSIAVISDELSASFKSELFGQIAPGNDVEIRSGAIRVSGHPSFVERTTSLVIDMLGDSEARAVMMSAPASILEEEVVDLVDAGSLELLSDIEDEEKPPVEQAIRSKPIRWVSDIPGYDTF